MIFLASVVISYRFGKRDFERGAAGYIMDATAAQLTHQGAGPDAQPFTGRGNQSVTIK